MRSICCLSPENLRLRYEPYRKPDPYAPLWRAFTAHPRRSFEFDSEATKGGKSAKLDGSFTATQALHTLLAGTGFVARLGSHGEFMITGTGAQADAGTPAMLSEVVVTAQKRTEKLSEVPMSVAVLSGLRLERSQSNSLQDIVNKVPGVQLVTDGPIDNNIVIRGIYANGVSSSTATYVDEVPYTSQGPFADSTNISPNLDPYDLARVEVLKGPQGGLGCCIFTLAARHCDPSVWSAER